MNVSDLIKHLNQYDGNTEVVVVFGGDTAVPIPDINSVFLDHINNDYVFTDKCEGNEVLVIST